MAFIVKRDTVVIPAGLPYSSTLAINISAINFTLYKNSFDGNMQYCFDNTSIGPPRPANWYAYENYNYDNGNGNRAILAFNTTATTYTSNQPWAYADIPLLPNRWYLIVFTAGYYDEGSYPAVPTSVYVNNSAIQSADYVPTTNWSPNITSVTSAPFFPEAIYIQGVVGSSSAVNGSYIKTNQAIGYLKESLNGSYNYQKNNGQFYITSPYNENSNPDYSVNRWIIASSADNAIYYLSNPSTDKFNFPITNWIYSNQYENTNSVNQSGPASITVQVQITGNAP